MKKLNKISLHNLGQAEMTKREQNFIKGGQCTCLCSCFCSASCACKYEGPQEGSDDSHWGGSSQAVSGVATSKEDVGNITSSTAGGTVGTDKIR